MTRRSTSLWGLVLGLVLVGCQSPTTGVPLRAGETQLVLQTSAPGSRALNLAAADYVTLQLTSADGRQTLFASSTGQGTGTYTLTVTGLVSGDWSLKVRFYASPSSTTLVYYANLTTYLAAGQSNPVPVALYQPATIDGLALTEAKPASRVGVVNLETGPWLEKGWQRVSLGHPLALKAEALTADDTPASDQRILWSSDDETVLEVTSSGVVSGLQPGTANVKATTVVGKVTATFAVTVDVDLVGVWEADIEYPQTTISRVAMVDVHRNRTGGLEATLWDGLDLGTTANGHSEEIGSVFPSGRSTYLFLPKTSSLNSHGPVWTPPVVESEPIPSTLTVISPDIMAYDGADQWEFRRSLQRIDSEDSPLPPVAVKSATVGQVLALGVFGPGFTPAVGGLLWSSSNPGIATVDAGGQVTFVAVGTVSIRAHATSGPDKVFKVDFEVRALP